jgi:hypothetical protein
MADAIRGRPMLNRGGNGAPATKAQASLADALGWPTEVPVATGVKGWHTALLDIAHPDLKVAVECDGRSHTTKIQQERDGRKDKMMTALGWVMLRFPNDTILADLPGVVARCQEAAKSASPR